ncbi:BTB/POZ domain-containing protein POB1-like [Asparagus officinalis]|uniref:BTB/POZ domain-containing protein POB1-like n=1 Tax=Asparagus officinalis TaxID=4686 RepID=UPI00098E29E0|nr:BTB/POZ domain-containing protein POB1-like [Asparagus officinalis]
MDLSHSSGSDRGGNSEFDFNSSNLSGRVLRIEIVEGAAESKPDGEGCSSIADRARHQKRRREDIKKKQDNIVNCDQPDANDAVAYESHDGEAVAKIESPAGDEPLQSDSSSVMVCSPLRVKPMYVGSAILAAKSPFLYKLVSEGMGESDQQHATLRITASEEAALMELLNFMNSGNLSTTSPHLLLDVLTAADKFEVASCVRHCSQLLRSLSMTTESALLYLELPSSVSMASAVQPLTSAAREFLANKYRNLSKFQEEVMNLPLVGIEAILSSDNLQVASEDAVYDFVLKWARAHYPKAEERRKILRSHLGRLIRFQHMTCRKLKKVLTCTNLGDKISSKADLALEALFFIEETPHCLTLEESVSTLTLEDSVSTRRCTERAYKYRPVKVVEFEQPHPQCIVYLDLKREEFSNLSPGGRIYSQAFHLGGQGFFLSAHCNLDQQSSFHCLGLFLGMQETGSVLFTVDYEFAARTKPAGDFVSKYKGCYTFTGGKAVGYRNLFAIPWTSFIAEDSPYFIDGVLHLRAELTLKQPPQQQQRV